MHPPHRPFVELARLVHFLERLAAVGPRDDDTVVAGGRITRDLEPQLLAVAIEEPNHRTAAEYNEREFAETANFAKKTSVVARVRSLALLSDTSTEMHTHHDQSDDARAANTAAPRRPASALR